MKESTIRFLSNHNPKDAIADVVNNKCGFKFRDHLTNEEIESILNWLETQGVKVVVK